MLVAIRHITDDHFSFRKTALSVQRSPTAAVLSNNTDLSEKCDFRSCFPILPGSAEAEVI